MRRVPLSDTGIRHLFSVRVKFVRLLPVVKLALTCAQDPSSWMAPSS